MPINPNQIDPTKKLTIFGIELQGERATGVGAPVAAADGANKDYVDTLVAATINGFDFKDAVETSTEGLGNIVLSGEQTLNGYLTSGSRVGVTEQTLPAANGIYITGAGAWTRALDADEDAEVTNGLTFFVADVGSSVAGQQYLLTTPDPIVVGVTALTFQVIPRLTLATVAPANVDKSAAVIGTSTRAAREDHKHDITTAAPAATGVAAASGEGVATSLARSDHAHQSNTAPADVTKAAAVIGVSGEPARADHKHDVSTAAAGEITDSTNAEGAATSLARSDHTHSHGSRGGGTLHAAATAAVAGFMSAADKDKLDNIPTPTIGTATTTDNTVTALSTIPLSDNTVYLVETRIEARRTDSADRAAYVRRACVYREAAGTATMQGAVETTFSRESAAGWNATIAVSGNDVVINVDGAVGHTINWRAYTTLQQVS